MKQDVLVWHAKAKDVVSREDARKYTEKNITVGNTYHKINDGAFRNNIKIHNVILDESVKEIGEEGFSCCTSLRQIQMKGVKIIRKDAFYNCTRLLSAEMTSVSHLGFRCFSLCKRLQKVIFSDENRCREIPREAFADCSALESISLPEGIQVIRNKAFYRCTSLKNVEFPETLEEIGAEAFLKCKEIKYVRVPENVKNIDTRAFYGCTKLEVLEIQGDLENIGEMIVNRNTKIQCKKGSKTEKYCKDSGYEVKYLD